MAVATALEILGAQAFLSALGADESDNMLVAVTAWFRQESGSTANVVGNNPFNIRPGAESYLAVGIRPGNFLVFPNIETGFKAAALLLKGAGSAYGYGAVVAAARSGNAINFLAALALSSWDIAHYGVTDYSLLGVRYTNNAYTTANHLLNVYSSFTGYIPPAGKGKGVTKLAPAIPPPLAGPLFAHPQPPEIAGPEAITRTWHSASDTLKFYQERHKPRDAASRMR